jgi:mannose-6-phosphate isomerase-like protein (cupin superfamily)
MTISTDNAEYYLWGDGCDGWHLLKSDALSVIEERMPAGAEEQQHYHEHAHQFFYVLEGTLTLDICGTVHVLKERIGVQVQPGTLHQVRNESADPVRFLVVSAPKSHGDRVNV